MDLQRAALDALADYFFDLGFQQVIRLCGAERDLEVAVIQRAHLDGNVDGIALEMGIGVARHAQQHSDFLIQPFTDVTLTSSMMSSTQIEATMMVKRVKASPARLPKALEPPTPPNAPDRP